MKLFSIKATKANVGGWKYLIQANQIANTIDITWYPAHTRIIKSPVTMKYQIAGGRPTKNCINLG